LNEEEFLKEFGEFKHLFNIVEEPTHSKEQLLKLNTEDKDYSYWHDRFIEFGGNLNDLK